MIFLSIKTTKTYVSVFSQFLHSATMPIIIMLTTILFISTALHVSSTLYKSAFVELLLKAHMFIADLVAMP